MKKLFILTVSLSIMLLCSTVNSWAFVLTGNYLNVGVDESGGLIDGDAWVGIQYDPTGSGTFGVADFLTPGDAFEFYSVGVNDEYQAAGYDYGNPFDMVTTDTSSGDILSAKSIGAYGDLSLEQILWFDKNSKVINFDLTATNLGGETLYATYARGLDPNQDAEDYGEYDTLNSIIDQDNVIATGPYSGWSIKLTNVDDPGGAEPSIDSEWNDDPYYLYDSPPDDGDGDNTINLAWGEGIFDPEATGSLHFTYTIGDNSQTSATTPEPATMALLLSGLAGLGILKKKRRI